MILTPHRGVTEAYVNRADEHDSDPADRLTEVLENAKSLRAHQASELVVITRFEAVATGLLSKKGLVSLTC